MVEFFIIAGIAFNVLLTGGVLWKLLEFAREWGSVTTKIESHERQLEQVWTELRKT